jgi:uncharacterized protein (DUF305 family)
LLASFGIEDMSAMGHDQHASAAGMATDEELRQLSASKGADFDRLFVQQMTAHHQGAIVMAETELRDGTHERTKDLAQAIITAQRAEIEEMRALAL